MKKLLLIFVFVLSFQLSTASTPEAIRFALLTETGTYHESRLCDVYKNFFQDNFGPGHILADTTRAVAYLRSELTESKSFPGPLYEPTGADGNFIRVNIGLISDGTIPFQVYFDAFVRSVQNIKAPSADQWRNYWKEVVKEINNLHLKFPNQQADSIMIAEKLKSGNFVVHHSKEFNNAYNFHYRIISREIFVNELLPLISLQNK